MITIFYWSWTAARSCRRSYLKFIYKQKTNILPQLTQFQLFFRWKSYGRLPHFATANIFVQIPSGWMKDEMLTLRRLWITSPNVFKLGILRFVVKHVIRNEKQYSSSFYECKNINVRLFTRRFSLTFRS